MDVMVLNVNVAWQLEFEDGSVMDAKTSEHVKDAAEVISEFADIIAVNEDPTKNIKTLEDVQFVMKEGKVYKN
jgi:N-succinyl-L-ornithine transcarbamylase